MDDTITKLADKCELFFRKYATDAHETSFEATLSGAFASKMGQTEPDLYAMADAVLLYFTLGRLESVTTRASREVWAERILAYQRPDGGFFVPGYHNLEHTTAYAIAALRLLEAEPDEEYCSRLRPPAFLLPIMESQSAFEKWIHGLDWLVIWGNKRPGSHPGGGIPAIIGMTCEHFKSFWNNPPDVDAWFDWYFGWLDKEANPKTGLWQRAIWNRIYSRPNIIDVGGAAHFLWIYDACKRSYPYPEQTMKSGMAIQRRNGLNGRRPYCIDLDANYCIVRGYSQLTSNKQDERRSQVHQILEKNFVAIVNILSSQPLEKVYHKSPHGLTGALVALVECTKFKDFRYRESLSNWQHVLDRAWWM